MDRTTRPRVKICCISSVGEAALAVSHGAAALGLVSEMPSGPGVIPEDLIARIARAVPPAVSTFLLTCLDRAEDLIAQARRCETSTLQICDRLEPDVYPVLHRDLPGVKLVQVIHVVGMESIEEACAAARLADALLLDSGNPQLAVKELGGTGRVHNWEISRRIRESVDVPVFLAGGLRSENVARGVREVGPFGVDVCSGVRTTGHLDAAKLAAFIAAVESASC